VAVALPLLPLPLLLLLLLLPASVATWLIRSPSGLART
jgi:hypothetical protein